MATELVRSRPWSFVLRGVIALLFGILMLAWPGLGLASFVLAYGAYSLADGLIAIVAAFAGRKARGVDWGLLLIGLLGIVVGLFFLFRPLVSVFALVLVIGAWFTAIGIISIIQAIRYRKQMIGEWLIVIAAIFPILFGLYLLIFPVAGVTLLPLLIGSFALAWGVLLLITAARLARHGRPPAESPAA